MDHIEKPCLKKQKIRVNLNHSSQFLLGHSRKISSLWYSWGKGSLERGSSVRAQNSGVRDRIDGMKGQVEGPGEIAREKGACHQAS